MPRLQQDCRRRPRLGRPLESAVTIGYWVTHRLGTIDTVLYWAAQVGGSILAAYLLHTMTTPRPTVPVPPACPEVTKGLP